MDTWRHVKTRDAAPRRLGWINMTIGLATMTKEVNSQLSSSILTRQTQQASNCSSLDTSTIDHTLYTIDIVHYSILYIVHYKYSTN